MDYKRKKWPTFWQWKSFFKVLTKKERIVFLMLFALAIASIYLFSSSLYYGHTHVAAAEGGTIVEGALFEKNIYVNPVYAVSDIDRDLTELVFSGLMTYSKDMEIIPDLARDYPDIEDDGRVYKFYLKENLFWQDGAPLTADDIIFTIKTIQNTEFNSPYLADWVGVKVEKVNDLTVKFTLQKPYAAFLKNCTLKIMPKHVWEQATDLSLEQTIGSGKYKIKEVKRNGSGDVQYITLERNNLYWGKKPYIQEIKFLFFQNQQDIVNAAKKGALTGFVSDQKEKINNWQENNLSSPRYFSVFFNQENSKVLAQEEVRKALNYATNKKEISDKIINSPVLPDFYGFSQPSEIYEFDLEKAKNILADAGFTDENGDGVLEKTVKKELAFTFKSQLTTGSDGKEVTELQKCLQGRVTGHFGSETKQLVIDFQEKYAKDILEPSGLNKGNGVVGPSTRAKLNEVCFGDPNEVLELKLTLVTVDQDKMKEIANILKNQWAKIGVDLQIQVYSPSDLEQEYIKPRNYDMLLFGEVLGAIPDPFPFWHSSQIKDPGLNLALYSNSSADSLLEENRKLSDVDQRKEKLEELQDIIIKDMPAIFLFSPDYYYFTSPEIEGVTSKKLADPSKRFVDIENWYIKTKRAWN
jgi:peptide/nickel transport system substrate-binding protein